MDKTLRVLQFVRVLDNGGIESLIFNLLDKTDRKLVNYDFLLTRDQVESYEESISKYDSHKIVVPIPKTGSLISRYYTSYKTLYSYFVGCGYRIVHFQAVGTSFGGSLALLAAKKAGIPVRIVHGHSAYSHVGLLRRIDVRLGQILHIKWGTHYMACSDKAAQFSFGRNYKRHITVDFLKNGIDTKRFAFCEQTRNEVREELNLCGKFVVGSIGRLTPPKNHLFMLDIMKELVKSRDDVVLLIVGSRSAGHEKYAQDFEQAIRECGLDGKVIYLGERYDVDRIYNCLDVYLFPSLWEGLGIAAVEAQANGLPVFAANAVPEEARLTSNFRYLSLEDSAAKWADEILHSNGRVDELKKVVADGYDIKNSAEHLQTYYLDIAENA